MATTLLMIAQEVIDLSFIGEENIKLNRIPDTIIQAAQENYIKPVFDGLYEKFLTGEYVTFVNDYIKPPLAYYVRYLVLPGISIQLSNMGAFVPGNDFSKGATDKQRDTLRQSALMIADPLLRAAIKYIEDNIVDFPEYIKKRRKTKAIKGGIIM